MLTSRARTLKTKMKKYVAHPEFIGADVELEDGSNTNELYELERKVHDAIRKVVEWRRDHMKESEWEQSVPQTLLAILEGWDHYASEVAAKSFLCLDDQRTHEKVVE